MTRAESLTIVGMITSHWASGKAWSKEEMDVYARLIQDLDAELTTSAVIRAAKEMQYRPSISELRERVRAERKRLLPAVGPAPDPKAVALPQWIREWICARLLYAKFGREKDERRFIEQGEWADPTLEVMPQGAWSKEAAAIETGALYRALQGDDVLSSS